MRKIFYLLALAMLPLVFTSCGDDHEHREAFMGTWRYTYTNGEILDYSFAIQNDGTQNFTAIVKERPNGLEKSRGYGTWSIRKNELILKYDTNDNNPTRPEIYTWRMEGRYLYLTDINDVTRKFIGLHIAY